MRRTHLVLGGRLLLDHLLGLGFGLGVGVVASSLRAPMGRGRSGGRVRVITCISPQPRRPSKAGPARICRYFSWSIPYLVRGLGL